MYRRWGLIFVLLGSALQAKIPRHLVLQSPSYIGGAGMFHNFNIVLGCLEMYDKQEHLALTIDFGKEGLYYDSAHGPNWWSYYFVASHYPFKEKVGARKALVKYFSDAEKGDIGNRAHFLMERQKAYGLIQKYIQIKPQLLEEVDAFARQHFQGKIVIGIHYRSTDKWLEAPFVSYQEVRLALEKALQKYEGQAVCIFVATDEVSFLEDMKKHYCICYTKAQRLDGAPIHYASQEGYLKGKEALIDCLLLAKSSTLIRTNSNLSAVAAYFNPEAEVINLNTVYPHLYQGLQIESQVNELNKKTKL